jgi:hypothetical protein
MKSALLFCSATALVAAMTVPAPAASTDAAILAAMKLADQSNYSWTASVVRDSRSYTIEGKTLVGGYTQVTVPASLALPASNPALRGRVSRGSTESGVVAIFKGDEKHVVETSEGWLTPAEFSSLPPAPRTGSGRRRGLVAELPLTFAISQPHEDIGIILGSSVNLRVDDGGIVTGRLSDTAARLLLLPPGQDNVAPEQAAGNFKFWISDGMLTRYEVQIAGIVSVDVGGSRRLVKTSQTVTTEIKDVGTTKLNVPVEVKAKLE